MAKRENDSESVAHQQGSGIKTVVKQVNNLLAKNMLVTIIAVVAFVYVCTASAFHRPNVVQVAPATSVIPTAATVTLSPTEKPKVAAPVTATSTVPKSNPDCATLNANEQGILNSSAQSTYELYQFKKNEALTDPDMTDVAIQPAIDFAYSNYTSAVSEREASYSATIRAAGCTSTITASIQPR